jgi:hypothetical protein
MKKLERNVSGSSTRVVGRDLAPQRSLLGISMLVAVLYYFVSILRSIDPGKSNPGRATSPKSSKAGTPGTCHAGHMNPLYFSDITINTSTSWCEIVQSGHVLPCTISSVPRRLERYTSEAPFYFIVTSPHVLQFQSFTSSCLLYVPGWTLAGYSYSPQI